MPGYGGGPGSGDTGRGGGQNASGGNAGGGGGGHNKGDHYGDSYGNGPGAYGIGYGSGQVDPGLAAAAGFGPAASGFGGYSDTGGPRGRDPGGFAFGTNPADWSVKFVGPPPEIQFAPTRQMPNIPGLFGTSFGSTPVSFGINPSPEYDESGDFELSTEMPSDNTGYGGGDNGGDGQDPYPYLLSSNAQTIAAPAEDPVAAPVLTPYEHLKQQWSGNNFLLAPIRRQS
jgi:hypothetical protein